MTPKEFADHIFACDQCGDSCECEDVECLYCSPCENSIFTYELRKRIITTLSSAANEHEALKTKHEALKKAAGAALERWYRLWQRGSECSRELFYRDNETAAALADAINET